MRRATLVRVWLVVVAACGVVGLTAFFGMDPKSEAAPAPVFRRTVPTQQEIEQLLEYLGHADPSERDRAFGQLLKIGPRVLESLRFRPRPDTLVLQMMKIRLAAQIQQKHGIQGVRCNGFEFVPFGDQVWTIPLPGQEREIALGVKMTNVGTSAVYCSQLPGSGLDLKDTEGVSIEDYGGGGEGEIQGPVGSLGVGQSLILSHFRGKLTRSQNGKDLCLIGRDIGGGCYALRDLRPGRYYLSFWCKPGPARKAEPRTPFDTFFLYVANGIPTHHILIDIR